MAKVYVESNKEERDHEIAEDFHRGEDAALPSSFLTREATKAMSRLGAELKFATPICKQFVSQH